jgi:tetratricopeptide (TPR) repeat protein
MKWHVGCVALFLWLAAAVCGQNPAPAPLIQAAEWNKEGFFSSTVSLLEPLVASDSTLWKHEATGVAWNLLGSAYRNLGEYERARRSYETAILILKDIPGMEAQYASALDNFGSLEIDLGHIESSRKLILKARDLYLAAGNHAGHAAASSKLALVEVEQGHLKEAESDLATASRETAYTQPPNRDNLADIYSIQCSLDGHKGDFRGALAAIELAIRLWTESHGERYYMLGIGYSLRGQIYDKLREYEQARQDLVHALTLFQQTSKTGTPVYFLAEIAYAHVLHRLGLNLDAETLEGRAKSSLLNFQSRQCIGCTVSAWSLR